MRKSDKRNLNKLIRKVHQQTPKHVIIEDVLVKFTK